MRKAVWFSAGLVVLAAVMGFAGAVLAAPGWVIGPAPGPIVIDGDPAEWQVDKLPAESVIVVSPSVSLVNAGTINTDEDSSAKVYLAYDDEALYVLAVVKDNNIVGEQAEVNIWQNTCVELWFNLGDTAVPGNPAAYGDYTDEDYQINLTPVTAGEEKASYWVYPGSKAAYNTGLIDVAAKLVEGGYIIEAKIPKAKFPGFEGIKPGAEFGFAVSLVHIAPGGVWSHIWTPGVEYAPVTVK